MYTAHKARREAIISTQNLKETAAAPPHRSAALQLSVEQQQMLHVLKRNIVLKNTLVASNAPVSKAVGPPPNHF